MLQTQGVTRDVPQPIVYTSSITATVSTRPGIYYGIVVTNTATAPAAVATVQVMNFGATAAVGSIISQIIAPVRATTAVIGPELGVRFSTLVVVVLGTTVWSAYYA